MKQNNKNIIEISKRNITNKAIGIMEEIESKEEIDPINEIKQEVIEKLKL